MNFPETKFLPYEETRILNELGYNAKSFGYWSDWGTQEPFLITCEYGTEKESCAIRRKNFLCSAILWQDAFDWFRDYHNLDGRIIPWSIKRKVDDKLVGTIVWYFSAETLGAPSRYKDYECKAATPKIAQLACLHKLIEKVNIDKVIQPKKYYRVCNKETLQGLWYDYDGKFTGLIHNDFNFCENNKLEMEFDPELVGWLSATDSLETLWKWFTEDDIKTLQEHGWFIHEFEAPDVKFYERFQHLIIKQDTSKVLRTIEL